MGFIWLKFVFYNDILLQEICQFGYDYWVEYIDFEKVLIFYMEVVEGYIFDEGDFSDEVCIFIILIVFVVDSESMINGEMQMIDECIDYFWLVLLG